MIGGVVGRIGVSLKERACKLGMSSSPLAAILSLLLVEGPTYIACLGVVD
jgi:hypothetical protein